MNRFLTEFAIYFLDISLIVIRSWRYFFKAGVALLTAYLIGMSQALPVFLEHEFEAKKLEYKIEALTSEQLENVDCSQLGVNQAACKLAVYKSDVVDSTFSHTVYVLEKMLAGGSYLVLFSMISFMLSIRVDTNSAVERCGVTNSRNQY